MVRTILIALWFGLPEIVLLDARQNGKRSAAKRIKICFIQAKLTKRSDKSKFCISLGKLSTKI